MYPDMCDVQELSDEICKQVSHIIGYNKVYSGSVLQLKTFHLSKEGSNQNTTELQHVTLRRVFKKNMII